MTTVLVCADGSPASLEAATKGLALLTNVERVVIATVVPDALDLEITMSSSGMAGPAMPLSDYEELEAARVADGESIVAESATALSLANAETKVLEGSAGPALCEYADQIKADAIIIGSRGHGRFRRAFLGSVSDHVVRHAPCPVLVTHPSK